MTGSVCLFVFIIILIFSADGVRVKPHEPFEVDGSWGGKALAVVVGDERDHWIETEDGFTIERNATSGLFDFISEDGEPLAQATPATKHVRRKGGRGDFEGWRRNVRSNPQVSGVWSNSTVQVGHQQVLAVTVSFSDVKIHFSQSAWHARLFTDSDSLRNFFLFNSHGKLILDPASSENCGTSGDGIATVDLPMAHPKDTASANSLVVQAALKSLSGCLDWDGFDTNLDGEISENELHIIAIFAGTEGALACATPLCPTTWAATQPFPPSLIVLGSGVSLSSAIVIGELGDCGCIRINSLGSVEHEFGHSLGLPDLYDTSENLQASTTSFSDWSLMNGGSWCEPFACNLDAWSRSYLGWVTPHVVTTGPETLSVTALGTNPMTDVVQLRLAPDGTPWVFNGQGGQGEFFLIENRQRRAGSWDAGIPGCGLLIWHVKLKAVTDNSINSALPHMVEPISSGNIASETGSAFDAFPGVSGNVRFDCDTIPSSRLLSPSAGASSCVNMRLISTTCSSSMDAVFNEANAKCTVSCCGDKDLTTGEQCEAGNGCSRQCFCQAPWKSFHPAELVCDGTDLGNVTPQVCGPSRCPIGWLNDGRCDPICRFAECGWDEPDCSLAVLIDTRKLWVLFFLSFATILGV